MSGGYIGRYTWGMAAWHVGGVTTNRPVARRPRPSPGEGGVSCHGVSEHRGVLAAQWSPAPLGRSGETKDKPF